MDLMRLALSSIGANRPRLPFLPNVMLIAVILSACATATEPRIVRVTSEVPVEVTRTVSERVEVIREVPVEVTRVVGREVGVTRVVSREVVKEVKVEVVVTPTPRARPTRRPATATPRPRPTATRAPTATPGQIPPQTTVPERPPDLGSPPPPPSLTDLIALLNVQPKITLDSDEVFPGDILTLVGEGFKPFTLVYYVLIGDLDVTLQPSPNASTDADGNFSLEILVPPLAPGIYQVQVGFREVAVTEQLRIHAPVFTGNLELVPPEASPGDLVTLKGHGLPPYVTVQYLLLNEFDVTPIPRPSTTHDGALNASILIPSFKPGTYDLLVLAGTANARTTLSISAP